MPDYLEIRVIANLRPSFIPKDHYKSITYYLLILRYILDKEATEYANISTVFSSYLIMSEYEKYYIHT